MVPLIVVTVVTAAKIAAALLPHRPVVVDVLRKNVEIKPVIMTAMISVMNALPVVKM